MFSCKCFHLYGDASNTYKLRIIAFTDTVGIINKVLKPNLFQIYTKIIVYRTSERFMLTLEHRRWICA